MMLIENKYDFGDIVYLVTDGEQLPRIVTSIKIFKNGELLYLLSCGVSASDHYDFEMTKEKDYTKV